MLADSVQKGIFFAARCYANTAYAIMRCLYVRPSHSWILSKWINISSKNFHHLVVPYRTSWQYSDGNPLIGSIECKWDRHK